MFVRRLRISLKNAWRYQFEAVKFCGRGKCYYYPAPFNSGTFVCVLHSMTRNLKSVKKNYNSIFP